MQISDLLEQLKNLPPAAFEHLIHVPAVAAVVHPSHLSSNQASQSTRAIELLHAMEREAALDLLRAEVAQAAQLAPMSSSHLVDGELDEIKGLLKEHKYELAHQLLARIERQAHVPTVSACHPTSAQYRYISVGNDFGGPARSP